MGLVPLTEDAISRAITLNKASVESNLRAFSLGRWSVAHPKAAARVIAGTVVAKPRGLSEQIALRESHLSAYQSGRLAARYRRLVDSITDHELREAVALGYHKLLSYKDEYEVARLHLDTLAKARAEFGGDLVARFHLAPPLISRTGPDGRPVKRAFGPWIIHGFGLLARLKGLRGTPLDPFGQTAERRMERALIAQYERDIANLIPELSPRTRTPIVELARLPLRIRGFGPVKAVNAEAAARRRAELLGAISAGGTERVVAAE